MDVYVGEKLLLRDVEEAKTYLKRLRGMIRRPISSLYIPRCHSIHTFFMKKPIDVIFLDQEMNIVWIAKNVLPRQIRMSKRAAHVLELDAHMADQLGLGEGQSLTLVK